MATNPRKRGKTTHGDITGRKAAKQAEEHRKAQQEAAAQTTMVAKQRAENDEIVDYTSPRPAPEPDPEVEYQDGSQTEPDEPDETIEAIVSEAEQPASREVGGIVRQDGPRLVNAPTALIRARFDLPQVTVGVGNTYDFEEGRKYEVPTPVAQHLAGKDLVDIL